MTKIVKEIKFDCAHMLSFYDGKCSNLHGHTYHGSVTIEGQSNPNTFMVLDYNTIKEVVDVLDHAVLISAERVRNEAESHLLKWCQDYGMRFEIIKEGKTTAEVLVKHILHMLEPKVPGCTVTVVLSETDGSFASGSLKCR